MSTICHFDYRAWLDAVYARVGHTYVDYPLNEQTMSYNPEITMLSVFISSQVTAKVLDQYPNLRVLMCRSAGTDHVDVAYAESKGISVHRVPGYGPHVIATHALWLLLSWIRSIPASTANTRAGIYSYTENTIRDLHTMTAGIIGTGKIGQEIGKMLHVFGVQLIAYDLYPNETWAATVGCTYTTCDKLFSDADIIVLACNATEENRHMIDGVAMDSMKQGVYLINIARGSLIDEDALLAHADKFAFIGLDAIQDESSTGLAKFAGLDNCLITPHIAYLADTTVQTIWEETYKVIG